MFINGLVCFLKRISLGLFLFVAQIVHNTLVLVGWLISFWESIWQQLLIQAVTKLGQGVKTALYFGQSSVISCFKLLT